MRAGEVFVAGAGHALHLIGDAVAALVALLPVPRVAGERIAAGLLFVQLSEKNRRLEKGLEIYFRLANAGSS